MSSRLLIKGKKYGIHQIEKKDGYGYDAKTLERLDSTMTKSLREAECPRIMCMDVQFPPSKTGEINRLFRSAQADYIKKNERCKIPTSYVGFKDVAEPNTIRLAVIYDSEKIMDQELTARLEKTINKRLDNEFETAEVICSGDSIPLAKSSYEQAFFHASSIAQVKIESISDRQRVLFASKC